MQARRAAADALDDAKRRLAAEEESLGLRKREIFAGQLGGIDLVNALNDVGRARDDLAAEIARLTSTVEALHAEIDATKRRAVNGAHATVRTHVMSASHELSQRKAELSKQLGELLGGTLEELAEATDSLLAISTNRGDVGDEAQALVEAVLAAE
jgi:hypothetical protein